MATACRRPRLRSRLLLGLLGYLLLLSAAVAVHGLVVNEQAERLVWQTLLTAELDQLEERQANDPSYRWRNTRDMAMYHSGQSTDIPDVLAALPPGVHDEVSLDGEERVVLVRESGGQRKIITLDISEIEQRERDIALTMAGAGLTLLIVLGALTAWGASRLVEPLSRIARSIGELRPEQAGQRLQMPAHATSEIEVIRNAINDFLARNDRFIERERLFIDMASHELRTPVAVIAGATELALASDTVPATTRALIERIRGTSKAVQELIDMLLVLAKDPRRLQGIKVHSSLPALLQTVIRDHLPLLEHKDLSVETAAMPAIEVLGPPAILQSAIGNLLRNAIENSDRGVIRVHVEAPAIVVITDPGHGMSAEEIRDAYVRIARGGGDRDGGGIGLDLIARVCEHLGWTLELFSNGHGSIARLHLQTGTRSL